MAFREDLNRRQFTKLAGGAAAALSLGLPLHAHAQDADATATAAAQGVQVTTQEEGKVNVTWWSHSNPSFVQANTDLITRFGAQNPDIHIVYQYFPYDVFVQKLQTGYSSGTVADIQQMFGTWVTEYAKFQLLDPMPDELAATVPDRFWQAAYGAYEWEGKFYGLPNEYNLLNGSVLVNPTLIAEAGATETPTTWQGMVDLAAKTAKWDGDVLTQAGLAILNSSAITYTYLAMILQSGGTYFAEDGTHVDLHSDVAKQAWADWTSLVTEYRVDNSQSYSVTQQELFFQGKAAMCIRGPFVLAIGRDQYPDFEFRFDPIPLYAGTEQRFAAESGWGEVVNAKADPEVKAAAWKFIDFIHQDDQMRDWNKTTFTVPSLQSLNNDPALLELAPQLATSFAAIPTGQWIGHIGDRDRFFASVFNAYLSVDIGQSSPEDALANAEREINAMIDEKLGV